MQRSDDILSYFEYELSAVPASLFDNLHMHKAVKSELMNKLVKGVEPATLHGFDKHVIDGGYLLHLVHWPEGGTYGDVPKTYVSYVNSHYGLMAVIVFDGYCNGPNTKDHEHERRSKKSSPDIAINVNYVAYKDPNAFLANDRNKKAFVALLLSSFKPAGHTVYQATNDADTLVAKYGLNLARLKSHKKISVVASVVMLSCIQM